MTEDRKAPEINGFDRWDDEDDGWDQQTGAPSIKIFSNALQVWSVAQNRTVTVAEAALAFNIETRRIVEAVEWHYWMFLSGDTDDPTKQTIEHEGE